MVNCEWFELGVSFGFLFACSVVFGRFFWPTDSAIGVERRVSPCTLKPLSRATRPSSAPHWPSKQPSLLATRSKHDKRWSNISRSIFTPNWRLPPPIPLPSLSPPASPAAWTPSTHIQIPTSLSHHRLPPSPCLTLLVVDRATYHGTSLQIFREWSVSFRSGVSLCPSWLRNLWFWQQHFRKSPSSRCDYLQKSIPCCVSPAGRRRVEGSVVLG